MGICWDAMGRSKIGGNMKVRYGFVSNSSTSSFCIYGMRVDEVLADKIEASQLPPP